MAGYDPSTVISIKNDSDTPVLIPRRIPQSLHEARVLNSSVRIEAGRYRVTSPPPFAVSSSIGEVNRTRKTINRPYEGQMMKAETSFVKIVDLLPGKTKRRVYFNEDEEEPLEEISSPKKVRLIKRFKKYEDPSMPGTSMSDAKDHTEQIEESEVVVSDNQVRKSVLEEQHEQQYVEEVDVIEEEGSVVGGYMGNYNETSVPVPRLHPISIGNVALVKQLRGENNYLKDQLDASFYRIKQLEALLVERNQRLKQLLRENVTLGVKIRKLTAEIGTETAETIMNS
ncbi:unnamed protein product [Auanema sp. JU1783]|nr:unnamed protein product [Auanema sp. JU1783]